MDKTALEQMINTYQDGLYRFAFFRTGSVEDAEDIVQNVFLNMYRSNKDDAINNIKAYLYKSVHNACINRHRAVKPITVPEIPEHSTETDNTLQPVLLKEQYKTVASLLLRLPTEQADVIRMRVIDELNFAEIATLLEEHETTVKSRFKYGMDKLKKIVKSKDYYHEMF